MHEMTGSARSRAIQQACLAIFLLAFATVPLWAGKGTQFLVATMLIQIVFALSFNLVFGLGGLLSFGHAAFFAAGAYTTGVLLQRLPDFPILLSLLAGAAAGGLVASAVCLVALRRASGVYFAILTLALSALLHIVISRSATLGREDGLTGIKRPAINLGVVTVDLVRDVNLYYFILLGALLCVGLLWFIWHSKLGRMLSAARQDPERCRFLGVNVYALHFVAFVISGVGTGFAGALYAPLSQLLTPEIAHWSYSALPLLFCLLGGVSYFWGPALGVVLFMGLEHAMRNVVGFYEIVIGLALLVIVLGFPGGALGGLVRLANRKRPAGAEQARPAHP